MLTIAREEVDKPFDLIWRWEGSWWRPIYRKGQRCRILIRGTKNSVLVEFEDGFKTVTSKWAVRPATARDSQQTFFTD